MRPRQAGVERNRAFEVAPRLVPVPVVPETDVPERGVRFRAFRHTERMLGGRPRLRVGIGARRPSGHRESNVGLRYRRPRLGECRVAVTGLLIKGDGPLGIGARILTRKVSAVEEHLAGRRRGTWARAAAGVLRGNRRPTTATLTRAAISSCISRWPAASCS